MRSGHHKSRGSRNRIALVKAVECFSFVLFALFLSVVPVSDAVNCDLSDLVEEEVIFNRTTGEYEFVSVNNDDNDPEDSGTAQQGLRRSRRTRQQSRHPEGGRRILLGGLESSSRDPQQSRRLEYSNNNNGTMADEYLQQNESMLVRECWCAERLSSHENLYCPLKYNMCSVTGSDGVQRCFRASGRYTFVRGIIPAMLFFLGCVIYAFVGSEQGIAARAYILRRLCVGRCGSRPEKEKEQLERTIAYMQQNRPHHVMWLLDAGLERMRMEEEEENGENGENPTVSIRSTSSAASPLAGAEALIQLRRQDYERRIRVLQERSNADAARNNGAGIGDTNNESTGGQTATQDEEEVRIPYIREGELPAKPTKLELKTRRYIPPPTTMKKVPSVPKDMGNDEDKTNEVRIQSSESTDAESDTSSEPRSHEDHHDDDSEDPVNDSVDEEMTSNPDTTSAPESLTNTSPTTFVVTRPNDTAAAAAEKSMATRAQLPDSDEDDEDEDGRCAICLGLLKEGDRVGDLPCGHVFHVDPCLKNWLKRKNACPLCNQEDIATYK